MSDCKGCGKCQEEKGNQEHSDDHEKHGCSCGSNPQPTVQATEKPKRVHLYPAKTLMDG
jgi:hypothetical protein